MKLTNAFTPRRGRENKNCKSILQQANPTCSVGLVMAERLGRCQESGVPACIHEEQFRPANKEQRDTEKLLGVGVGG